MPDKIYRIYCQDTDRRKLIEVLRQTFNSFTILPAIGWYKGQREASVVIEVYGTTRSAVNRVCRDLVTEFKQDMVTFSEILCYIAEVFNSPEE